MHNPEPTHHIQLTILRQMMTNRRLRYSDLKPPELEANAFMYHLNLLIKQGLIEKHDKQYVLTRRGNQFADRATLASMRIRVQPKIVTILTIRRADGHWLLLRRKYQPFMDYKGFPSGKLHYGETLLQAAERELQEKSGITGVSLQLRGNVIIRFLDDGEPINHIIGYVFYAEVPLGTVIEYEDDHYHTYFATQSELFEPPCYKGHQKILEYLETGTTGFIEEADYQSDY